MNFTIHLNCDIIDNEMNNEIDNQTEIETETVFIPSTLQRCYTNSKLVSNEYTHRILNSEHVHIQEKINFLRQRITLLTTEQSQLNSHLHNFNHLHQTHHNF